MGETIQFTKVYERRLEHPVTTIARHAACRIEAEQSAKRAWRVVTVQFVFIAALAYGCAFLYVLHFGWR